MNNILEFSIIDHSLFYYFLIFYRNYSLTLLIQIIEKLKKKKKIACIRYFLENNGISLIFLPTHPYV